MPSSSGEAKPRIAVFAGPTATILNSHPLVTSEKARRRHGLPSLGAAGQVDALRPQRLAAPVTVYVEQFSAHPLERDAAHLYAPPDGYLAADGTFSPERQGPDDTAVYEVELRPEDGLYPLPFMGRQADGSAWDGDATRRGDPAAPNRQPFYPDASRLFEEIDRLENTGDGTVNALSRQASFDFYRPAPPGGYTRGLPGSQRTDVGQGDIPPEQLGVDFFPYRPVPSRREPLRGHLARLTNVVQQAMDSGSYAGGVWLEGSPYVEETSYWLNLLIDTDRPIAACAGSIGTIGAANVIDAVTYINSGIWGDSDGRDQVGVVCIEDEQVFTAREVQKTDDRPGGYVATGGHGGIVASMGKPGRPVLTFRPVRAHTSSSQVRMTALPAETVGVRPSGPGTTETIPVRVKEASGELRGDALPSVRILKHTRYWQRDAADDDTVELELFGRFRRELERVPLIGFVVEAGTPYGDTTAPVEAGLREAALMGAPFVKVGRGDVGGFVPVERVPFGIAGGNLTATKARLLLMACLLRFGAVPPARDPRNPTAAELSAAHEQWRRYQQVFDTH